MRGRRKRPPGKTARQRAWFASAQAADQRRDATRQSKAVRRGQPKCGAARKSDRQPCRNLSLANGRCRLHGGCTGAGKDWHKVLLPLDPVKRAKKVRELERRRQAQRARVDAMTPEQRARYDAWHRTHRPGSPAEREQRRRDRDAKRLLDRLQRPPQPVETDPRAEALATELAALRARLARLRTPNPNDREDANDE